MRKKLIFNIAAVAGILLVLGGVGLNASGALRSGEQETDDAFVAADYILVAPRIAGIVSHVLVEDNQRVKSGDVIARIDDRDFQSALVIATTTLQAATSRIGNIDARLERQKAIIAQAEAAIAADDAALVFAEQNAKRYQNLSEQGAGTMEQQQQSAFALRQQTALRQRDSAALSASQKEQGVLSSERVEAEAAIAHAQAAVDKAKLDLSYTTIAAPADGLIGQRSVRAGAYVQPGTSLLAVVPLRSVYVVGNFRETQLTHVHPHQRVDIRVDSLPDVILRAHVDSIAPATGLTFSPIAPDNATGNFTKVAQRLPVKIVFEENQPQLAHLKVGMSVTARIDIADKTAKE